MRRAHEAKTLRTERPSERLYIANRITKAATIPADVTLQNSFISTRMPEDSLRNCASHRGRGALFSKTYEKRIKDIAKKFSKIEGVNLDVMGKDELEANATIHLISKSNAKEYLPDLMIGYKELTPDNKSYFPATENSRKGLVCFSTRYKRTAIRFFNFYNRES